eukprot:XP_001704394.1 Hypothetical protein GL50803_112932 [Giardia lamblia ATCC 50803]
MRLCLKSGSWYPLPKEAKAQVAAFLRKAGEAVHPDANVRFIIAPHAGLVYSGLTAAHSYSSIDPTRYTSVVMLGVCHAFHQRGLSTSPFASWANPLMEKGSPSLSMETIPGLPSCQKDDCEEEHSLELQIPFLAHVFANQIEAGTVKFSAVYCSYGATRTEIDSLMDYVTEHNSLIVVSSDFCHYGPRFQFTPMIQGKTANETVTMLDNKCINGVMLGANSFEEALKETQNTVCGHYTILTCLRVLEGLKLDVKKELLFYTKSDEPRTARDHSVSYVSMRGIQAC